VDLKKIFLILFLSLSAFASNDFYPKQDVCESLGLYEDALTDDELKRICYDFSPTALQKQTVLEALNNAGERFGDIITTLRAEGVPDIIIFLAVTESNFSPKYANKSTYAGFWQLSKFEARFFDLVLNPKKKIDERRDVDKSTEVIIKILKSNFREFGSWALAIMAYNAGEFRLKNAIKRAGTNDLSTLLDPKKRYLSRTTATHLKRIIIYAGTANHPPVYDKINKMFIQSAKIDEDKNETNRSY
jgi:membrane-bound lytic murein transglycosylase D